MSIETARIILREIESQGKSGCGVLCISSATNISQADIREFLNENPDMVCKSSTKPTYTINRFGVYKGSVDKMLEAIGKGRKTNHTLWYLLVAVTAFNLGLALGNAN